MASIICSALIVFFSLLFVEPGSCAVVAFTGGGYKGYETWNWTAITHLGFWTAPTDSVRALAKQNGVRLFQDSQLPDPSTWTSSSSRKQFAQEKAQQVQSVKLDGVFFDYEGNHLSSKEKEAYTELAKEVTAALKPYNASLFVCVGGRPTYELRDYDYKGLSENSEFLFIMGYDMTFWDDYTCLTDKETCSPAEAPTKDLKAGIEQYLQDVPSDKLVLGLPWYGMNYQKILGVLYQMDQIDYGDVLGVFDDGKISHKSYDNDSDTWIAQCKSTCTDKSKGNVIWYDDAKSLAPKYKLAKDHNLHGVGMWKCDSLSTSASHAKESKDMWDAISWWDWDV